MTTWNVRASMPARQIQEAVLYAKDGDTVFFDPVDGDYTLTPIMYESILYAPNAPTIDLSTSTILAGAGSTSFLPEPEYAIGKYAAFVGLFDASFRYTPGDEPTLESYNHTSSVLITIDSVHTTTGNGYDTYKLSIDGAAPYQTLVPIVAGTWQDLVFQSMEVKFDSATGHTLNDVIYVYPATTCLHMISFGHGYQSNYINAPKVIGQGFLDPQFYTSTNPFGINARTHESQAETGSIVCVNGRVRNTVLKDYRSNADSSDRHLYMRAPHSGYVGLPFSRTNVLNYGARMPGVAYGAEYTLITGTEDEGGFLAYILGGHPSMRGAGRGLSIRSGRVASVEPNFRSSLTEITDSWEFKPTIADGWRGGKTVFAERNTTLVVNPNPSKYPFDPHTPTGWPEMGNWTAVNNVENTSAIPAPEAWVDTFPETSSRRAPLFIDIPFTHVGFVEVRVYTPSVINAINAICTTGGGDLRASWDPNGLRQIPIARFTNETGDLVGVCFGMDIPATGPQQIYVWGGSGELPPPRVAENCGEWRALWPGTVLYPTGDKPFFAKNTQQIVTSARLTSTNAKLGTAITFNGTQNLHADGLLRDDDSRQWENGMYHGAWLAPSTGGRWMSFGNASLKVDPTLVRATLGTLALTAPLTGTLNHIGYHLTPTTLSLLVNGVVAASGSLDGRYTRLWNYIAGSAPGTAAIRLGGSLVAYSWVGTAGQISFCNEAPALAAIADYVAVCNNQGKISIGAFTNLTGY